MTLHSIFQINYPDYPSRHVLIKGRERWALHQLIKADKSSCSTIDTPAPRLWAYIYALREKGLEIETIQERHGGEYPGTHGRYVLRDSVCEVAK